MNYQRVRNSLANEGIKIPKLSEREIENRTLNFLSFFAPVSLVLKWIAMYRDIRNGLLIAAIILMYAVFLLIGNRYKIGIKGRTDKCVWLYLIYNVVLCVPTVIKGYPSSMLLSEIANSIIPILFYFIGNNLSKRQSRKFEDYFQVSAIILLIVGVFYNIRMDDPYYIAFLKEANPNFSLHGFSIYPRLNAMFGSVVCGNIGCICMCLSFRYLEEKKNVVFWILFIANFALAMLTMQRSAMLCAIVGAILMLLWAMKKNYLTKAVPIGFSIIVVLLAVGIGYFMPNVYNSIFNRFGSFSSAISERNGGWRTAFENGIISTIFGYGTGTGGQRAIGLSLNTVNDGNYFKIIYECGLVGLFLLMSCFFSTLRYRKVNYIYFISIILCLIQMVGSNLLTFQMTACIFWYLIGRIINNSIKSQQESEEMI